jgi:two-component system sensor kinase FixL
VPEASSIEGTVAPIPPGDARLQHRRARIAARLIVALLAGIILVSAIAAYRVMGEFIASSQRVNHSHEVVELLNEVHTLVASAESAIRGYVIAGGTEYLAPYEQTRSELPAALTRLRGIVADNADQSARVAELETMIDARMKQLDQAAAARRGDSAAAAAQNGASGEGLRLMNAVRGQIAELRAEETRLLDERVSRTAIELAQAKRLLLLITILTIALLALAILFVERDIGRAERDLQAESAARRDSLTALDERAEQTRVVRDSIFDAIITIDEGGLIRMANAATERMFGYREGELIGQNVKMLMPAPYRDEHDGYLAAYRATGTRKIIGIGREVNARHKNGTIFPIDLAVSEANVEHRRLFTGVVRDLTDRKRTETELRDLQRTVQERTRLADIGAVTAQIVHDLGNPIAGLSMQVQRLTRLLRRGEQPSTTLLPLGDQILGSMRRLDTLLHELRDFSRQQRLELNPVDLRELLAGVHDLWRPVATAQDIAMRVDYRYAADRVVADEAKLVRVLDNLVKNAIEAIGQGPGEVCLSAGASESPRYAVRISVSDTGAGIPESVDVFRLFETTKPSGSGLGLSIARRIVEAHGGGLSFTKNEPHGTIFHIDIPAEAIDAGRSQAPSVL